MEQKKNSLPCVFIKEIYKENLPSEQRHLFSELMLKIPAKKCLFQTMQDYFISTREKILSNFKSKIFLIKQDKTVTHDPTPEPACQPKAKSKKYLH